MMKPDNTENRKIHKILKWGLINKRTKEKQRREMVKADKKSQRSENGERKRQIYPPFIGNLGPQKMIARIKAS